MDGAGKGQPMRDRTIRAMTAVSEARAALAESVVESDGSSVRLIKARGERSRQDVVMALTLACGRVPRVTAHRSRGYAVA